MSLQAIFLSSQGTLPLHSLSLRAVQTNSNDRNRPLLMVMRFREVANVVCDGDDGGDRRRATACCFGKRKYSRVLLDLDKLYLNQIKLLGHVQMETWLLLKILHKGI